MKQLSSGPQRNRRWEPGASTVLALIVDKMPTESQVLCGNCSACGNFMRADYFHKHVLENHLERRSA